MADKTFGRLLSRSVRRHRDSRSSRGSLDADLDVDTGSLASDDATLSRGRSLTSRSSELADNQSHDTRSTHGITLNVPDDHEGDVTENSSLASHELDDSDL